MDWGGRAVLLGAALLVVSAGCAGGGGQTLAAGQAQGGGPSATSTTAAAGPGVCTPLAGVAEGDEVSVAAQWKPGDGRDFTITRERARAADDLPDDLSYRTDVRVEVVDVGPDGTTMRWRQSGEGLFESASLDEVMGQLGTRLLERLEDLTVDYSLDADGRFEKVINREAIRGYLERMMAFMKDVAGDGAERKVLDRVVEMMRPVVLADGFIDTAVAQHIITFHGPYGVTLSGAGTRELDDELPNPFGGQPIGATSSFEVLTPQDPQGCLRLRMVTAAKPGALSAITDTLAGATGLNPAAREKLRESAKGMTLRGEHRWVIDPTTSWPVSIESTKTTADPDTTNTDTTIIEAK